MDSLNAYLQSSNHNTLDLSLVTRLVRDAAEEKKREALKRRRDFERSRAAEAREKELQRRKRRRVEAADVGSSAITRSAVVRALTEDADLLEEARNKERQRGLRERIAAHFGILRCSDCRLFRDLSDFSKTSKVCLPCRQKRREEQAKVQATLDASGSLAQPKDAAPGSDASQGRVSPSSSMLVSFVKASLRDIRKRNNRRRGTQAAVFEISITTEWVQKRWEEVHGCCELCGEPMTLEKRPAPSTQHRTFTTHPLNLSLDQIVHSGGYTPGNTQLCHVRCNLMKLDMDMETFVDICKRIGATHFEMGDDEGCLADSSLPADLTVRPKVPSTKPAPSKAAKNEVVHVRFVQGPGLDAPLQPVSKVNRPAQPRRQKVKRA